MKKIIATVVAVMLAICTLCCMGCSQTVKVTYNANGGLFEGNTELFEQEIEKDSLLKEIDVPKLSKHSFLWWARTPEGEGVWQHDSEKVEGDVTLYAVWTDVFKVERRVVTACRDINATELIIPEGIIGIDSKSFQACKSLTRVEIPKSVKRIGERIFFECESLTEITYQGTKAEWNSVQKGYRPYYLVTTVHCVDGDLKVTNN